MEMKVTVKRGNNINTDNIHAALNNLLAGLL
jgi:hypothetical protein